jgi:hypothetical protein
VEWSGTLLGGADPVTFTFGVDTATGGWVAGEPITNVVTFAGSGLVFSRTTVTRLDFADPSPSHKQVDKDQALAGDVLTYTIDIQQFSIWRHGIMRVVES